MTQQVLGDRSMEQLNDRPTLLLLSPEAKAGIRQSVLHILSEMGMQVFHEEGVELLKEAGCAVDEERVVRIPESLVKKSIQKAPGNIPIYNRDGQLAMDLGGDRSYYGTGSDLLYTLDMDGQGRHRSLLEDVRRAARVCDGLPNIDFIMSFAHPSDVLPHQAYLRSFQAMAECSTKPIVCTAEGRHDLAEMRQIAVILRGGDKELRSQPYFVHYAEPTSPRKHPVDSVDKLLFCAETGTPVVYSPAPMAGATAPMTIAGHVAQGLAESLCGLVIHQLKAEGAPFIMGMGPAVMDMVTAQSSYNAPEYYLAYLAAIEMIQDYGLPSWGYAGTSDAQVPDGQATFEAGLCTFLSAMTGANLCHDVGYLDFGRTGSLEMVVILDELIGQIKRLRRGMPVNEETLALDVMEDVGLNGHFLSHLHTMKHVSATQWRPKLTSRLGYDRWQQSGSSTLLDRARKTLEEILETHQPPSLAPEKAAAIKRVVEESSL
jgi:trimethylamine--corrinoid protein Co-methyltransferase